MCKVYIHFYSIDAGIAFIWSPFDTIENVKLYVYDAEIRLESSDYLWADRFLYAQCLAFLLVSSWLPINLHPVTKGYDDLILFMKYDAMWAKLADVIEL